MTLACEWPNAFVVNFVFVCAVFCLCLYDGIELQNVFFANSPPFRSNGAPIGRTCPSLTFKSASVLEATMKTSQYTN